MRTGKKSTVVVETLEVEIGGRGTPKYVCTKDPLIWCNL